MIPSEIVSRRQFLQASAAVSAVATGGSLLTRHAVAAEPVEYPLAGRLYKTLKIGMVGVEGSLTDKFKAAKAAGFGAIELNAPGFNIDEVNAAVKESGLPVDGSVCANHWGVRHTDPDPAVRAQALATLQEALRTTNAVGGKTVLLVVGRGTDGTEEECWKRSIENISKAIPLAAELGIAIAIENVWNQFCYDHDGGADQSAEKFVRYVDELNSPFVGMQFDIGNHWKYGAVGDWIRALGKRIVKLDVKGFSRATNKFTKIGEGDIDWLDIRKSLTEINFYGWCAAEVGGGGPERLAEISANMDKVFGLKS
ncbi:TIM barrel protein [bacterium]|nr:TIM barrel protein [bacterium]